MSRDQLPLSVPALTAVAAVVIAGLGGYAGLIVPAQREIARLEREVNAAPLVAAEAPVVEPVSDAERRDWQTVEARLRDRFVPTEDQRRVLVEVGRLARAHGLRVTELRLSDGSDALPAPSAPGSPPAPAAVSAVAPPPPFSPPPPLAVNPFALRLVTRGRFAALAAFLAEAGERAPYLALQSLDVRRVDSSIESDIRLASLRLEGEP